MSDKKISRKRLKELERLESKMNALEAGGVDNWEWYQESLKGWFAENELDERLESLMSDLECAFGECAYEPSERGAGIAFDDSAGNAVMEVFKTHRVTFLDLLGDDE